MLRIECTQCTKNTNTLISISAICMFIKLSLVDSQRP